MCCMILHCLPFRLIMNTCGWSAGSTFATCVSICLSKEICRNQMLKSHLTSTAVIIGKNAVVKK